MKNRVNLFGNLARAAHATKVPLVVIALVAVIGFSMASCDSDCGICDTGSSSSSGSKKGIDSPNVPAEVAEHTTHIYGSWEYFDTTAYGKKIYMRKCTICDYMDSKTE